MLQKQAHITQALLTSLRYMAFNRARVKSGWSGMGVYLCRESAPPDLYRRCGGDRPTIKVEPRYSHTW